LKEALDDLRNDPNRRTPGPDRDDYAESPGKAQRHFYPNAAGVIGLPGALEE
jgi:hypothetical protein